MTRHNETVSAERTLDLLLERLARGLHDEADERELAAGLDRHPEIDVESFELAVAAAELAATDASDPLPPALRQRLAAQASAFERERRDAAPAPDAPGGPVEPMPFPPRSEAEGSLPGPRFGAFAVGGWLLAAATILLAVALWPPTAPIPVGGPPVDRPTDAPPGAEGGLRTVADAEDALRLEWSPTDDPAAADAGGEVVWSTAEQRGFMVFRGLPVNDPTVEQYQLWIFDATQDERYPVDGGVFDIADDGEVVVAIDAKLVIEEPTLFAITVEKPGGVVVSSRERLPLKASVG